ncbi:MAG: pentapeptide repeat-containing protein [Candidatus Electrothrix sp. AW1]|nr:pentapeptide repeat-containing protein [Candidatus Electrothrix sp. AX1]MCI5178510.1 pentapeptide repeat-containing protein [Candidatus Electrothrix gigas]MCI5181966.1 pentapeptide repeat-containing protein [Candidatus Electrothrix gigas]
MDFYELVKIITLVPGGVFALLGFLRSQELQRDSAFSEIYTHLGHNLIVVRAAAASRLPSFYHYRRLAPVFCKNWPFVSFKEPYKHQVLLLALSALKQNLSMYPPQEQRNFRQAIIDALGTILGERSLREIIDLLPDSHRGANLDGAVLDELRLYDFKFDGTDCTEASFVKSDLGNASLSKCKLWKTKFTNAKLAGANFNDADIWETDFTNADLSGAKIIVPNADNFNRHNTCFRGAKLDGATISENVADLCREQGHDHKLHLVTIVSIP